MLRNLGYFQTSCGRSRNCVRHLKAHLDHNQSPIQYGAELYGPRSISNSISIIDLADELQKGQVEAI